MGLEHNGCLPSSSRREESLRGEFGMLERLDISQEALLPVDSGMSLLQIEDSDEPVLLLVTLLVNESIHTVSKSPLEKFGIPQLKQVKVSSERVYGRYISSFMFNHFAWYDD